MSAAQAVLGVVIASVWWVFGFAWWRMPTWGRWVSPALFVILQFIPFVHGIVLVNEHPWTLAAILGAGVAGAFVSARLPS